MQVSQNSLKELFVLQSAIFGRAMLLFLVLFFASVNQLFATHLRAGQIRVIHKPGTPRTVIIKIQVWTNIENTTVLFGGDQDVLDFGDGKSMLVPETQNMDRRPGGPPLPSNVKYAEFEIEHTYDAPGIYIVSYKEPNRNEGVLNMDASVTTTFYLETKFIIDPFIGENTSPELAIDPIDRACPGVAFFHNPGASDPDEQDRLSYSMKIPFSDRNRPVINYRDPDNINFYTNHGQGNEAGTGTPVFNINEETGTITWDAPGRVGEYNIAFHIIEHREINGIWREIGYVRRDMQILVEDCDNERPTLELPPDTCVIAGTTLIVPIVGQDPDGDPVKIEAFSPVFGFTPPASISPDPKNQDVFVPVPAVTMFEWQTECNYVKDQPYFVVFKITDNPPLGPRLATFETWSIKVVGDKPRWDTYTKDNANRSVNLQWEDYYCQNAVSMQIWRKVDGSDFEPDNCQTGMPSFLGYELVGTVPITPGDPNSFTDTNNGLGLDIGPKYCYRLVAVFPEETGALSLVSDDICVDPFELVTPVVTNVDVAITSGSNGEVIVRWMPPLENPTFPSDHPFRYELWRGVGPSGDSVLIQSNLTDTTFIDSNLDTEGTIYNYTVHAYSNTDVYVGASSQASTVRLEAASELREIELTWSADVPWSNSVTSYTHKIYRGDEGSSSIDDLVLIDEVTVSAEGFVYEDRGQWNNEPLVADREYCYMVETYGSYGNELIPAPLINRSQIICALPGDDEAPCKPEPPVLEQPRDCSLDGVTSGDCAGASSYINKLRWTKDESECGRDISYYIVYFSNSINGDFRELARLAPNVTEFDDILSRSYKRCYKIAAVDRSGNVSEMSESFCVDNCPYYELPSVFTPNRDGCNDLFRAYNNESFGEDGGSTPCSPTISLENQRKCARFVEEVVFRVFNRWGREVYSYTGVSGASSDAALNPILINWDGRSNEGVELATGVYYYVAEVTFDSIFPENQHKTIKGWVHLIRSEN